MLVYHFVEYLTFDSFRIFIFFYIFITSELSYIIYYPSKMAINRYSRIEYFFHWFKSRNHY